MLGLGFQRLVVPEERLVEGILGLIGLLNVMLTPLPVKPQPDVVHISEPKQEPADVVEPVEPVAACFPVFHLVWSPP